MRVGLFTREYSPLVYGGAGVGDIDLCVPGTADTRLRTLCESMRDLNPDSTVSYGSLAQVPDLVFALLGILLLFSWVSLVGLVRAEFLRGRNFEYIQAARALGVSNAVIMFRHLLPNAMVATMTFLPFIVSSSVMTLTALDFLGFGLPPGSPSLGELLSQGKANVQAPWLGFTGFFAVAIMLSLLIFIGEAVRDAFDPRKTFR